MGAPLSSLVPFAPLLEDSPRDPDARHWRGLEMIREAFMGTQGAETSGVRVRAFGALLSELTNSYGPLTPDIFEKPVRSDVSVRDTLFRADFVCPVDQSRTALGAAALLEGQAMAAQMLGAPRLPRRLDARDDVYHVAQRLFNAVFLPSFQHLHPEHARAQRPSTSHTPFSTLVRSDGEFSSPARRLAYLFSALVELALNPPLGRWALDLVREHELNWVDLHPGWRFVRLLEWSSRYLALRGTDALALWLVAPDAFITQASSDLAWPQPRDLSQVLWPRIDALIQQTGSAVRTDHNRIRARSWHVAKGLLGHNRLIPTVWLPVAGPDDRDFARRCAAVLSTRAHIMSAWPPEAATWMRFDQSVSVDWGSGNCIWSVQQVLESNDDLDRALEDDASCEDLLARAPRPLGLEEAISTEFFYLELLRMLMLGSDGAHPAELLADAIVSPVSGGHAEAIEATRDLLRATLKYCVGI
jgi:hypothetical protein